MPAMQPIRNSSPFVPRLCFLTASRCEERCHDTNHYVSMVNVANTLLTYFLCGVFFCLVIQVYAKKPLFILHD